MKNKIFTISLILTIIACIPILFVGTSQLYGFLAELNYYILSPFCFPTLILMPWVYNNKKLYKYNFLFYRGSSISIFKKGIQKIERAIFI